MIDLSKTYQTRDGRKVRLLMTDGGDIEFPVVGAYAYDNNTKWQAGQWRADGSIYPHSESAFDLIEQVSSYTT